MALEEYERKRDFKQTPEPPPKLGKNKQQRFVVQKHRATRLHYDFRLEMEGVLKSWAVPKGPSLDPADKRLAMQVEDHPVSYFDFEGVIPTGNYGAGTVMVWDVGTWEPLGNAAEMLKKGDLKFRLNGEKLKGDFALVHIRSRRSDSKGNEWLLIKHRDAYVEPGYDIDAHDGSVLSGLSMDEIAGDSGAAEWQSGRKASTARATGKNAWLADSIAKADARKLKSASNSAATSSSKASAAKSAATQTKSAAVKSSAAHSAKRRALPASKAGKKNSSRPKPTQQ